MQGIFKPLEAGSAQKRKQRRGAGAGAAAELDSDESGSEGSDLDDGSDAGRLEESASDAEEVGYAAFHP